MIYRSRITLNFPHSRLLFQFFMKLKLFVCQGFIGIPLICLSLPDFCICPKLGPVVLLAYVVGCFFTITYMYTPEKITTSVYMLGLWCVMPLSTIIPLYRGDLLYWLSKLEYPEKTFDLLQVTDILYYIIKTNIYIEW